MFGDMFNIINLSQRWGPVHRHAGNNPPTTDVVAALRNDHRGACVVGDDVRRNALLHEHFNGSD
jgi:hypothetical protein